MNQGPDSEARLRQAFEDLRDADASRSPAFDTVLRPRSRAALRPRWPVLSLAAAVMVAGVLIARAGRGEELVVPQEVIALSSWTAPTDVLLEGARLHLVTQAPSLGASMVDTLRGKVQ